MFNSVKYVATVNNVNIVITVLIFITVNVVLFVRIVIIVKIYKIKSFVGIMNNFHRINIFKNVKNIGVNSNETANFF